MTEPFPLLPVLGDHLELTIIFNSQHHLPSASFFSSSIPNHTSEVPKEIKKKLDNPFYIFIYIQ